MKKTYSKYLLFLLLVPVVVIYYIFLALKKKNKTLDSTKEIKDFENISDLDGIETAVLPTGLNPRQMDLLKYVQKNGEGRVSDMMKIFSKTTDRTLRRDFNKLENLGFVQKSGSTKSASYRLVK